MTSEIVKRKQNEMTFQDLQGQAAYLLKSGFLPASIKTPEQAVAIMLTGRELGLGLMESFRSINVIQGRPAMAAQLLLGLCRRTGEVEQAYFSESNNERVTFVLKRKNNPEYRCTFTRAEADQAKFTQQWDKDKQQWKVKDNWAKQPKTMLEWRAISRACRVIFPDAICGLYTQEELSDAVTVEENSKGDVAVTEIAAPDPVNAPPAMKDQSPEMGDVDFQQLAQFQLPFGIYNGQTLSFIYDQKTEGGDEKGRKYLQWVTNNAQDMNVRKIVGQFLAFMSQEREPGSEG